MPNDIAATLRASLVFACLFLADADALRAIADTESE